MITFDFDQETGIVRVTLTGEFLLDDVKHFIKATITHADFRSGMDVLVDARQANMSYLTSADIVELKSHAQKFFPQRGSSNIAWVTERDVDYGLVRMYELRYEADLPGSLQVFRSISNAEAWLLNQPKKGVVGY